MTHSQIETIRFGFLFEQLTIREQKVFFNYLLSKQQTIVVKALKYCIMQEESIGKQLNSTLTRIIQLRKETKSKSNKTLSVCTLATIPEVLIGKCASFLDQIEYTTFCRTNRIIYMGCNNPNVLQHVDLTSLHSTSFISFPIGQSIRCLTCNVDEWNYERLCKYRFSNLQTLRLCVQNFLYIESMVDLFDCTKIFNLCLYSYDSGFAFSAIANILSKFVRLKHVAFNFGMNSDSFIGMSIPDPLLHLEGITIIEPFAFLADILEQCASQWKYLNFRQNAVTDINFANYQFSNLNEFKAQDIDENTLLNVLKSAFKLKRIMLDGKYQSALSISAITTLFETCVELEYIRFDNYSEIAIPNILRGIEEGLSNRKANPCDKLIICMNLLECLFDDEESNNWNNMLNLTKNMALSLQKCTQNFMVSFEEQWFSNQHFDEKLREVLPESINVNFFELSDDFIPDEQILLYNKHCAIEGLYVKWRFDDDISST